MIKAQKLIPLIFLVAVLISFTGWGMGGIMYATAIALLAVFLGPKAGRKLKQGWNHLLSGSPSRADYALAPSGYRRARQAETEEEAVRESVVVPTPNRPLVVESTVERAIARSTPTAVVPVKSARLLQLAEGCTPPIEMVIGRAVLFLGIRGSGKTNALARFLEQMCKAYPIPALICDYEEGFLSFSSVLSRCVIAGSPEWNGQGRYKQYWKVTPKNAREFGYMVLEYGVQAVLQIGSYETLEEAATIMTLAIRGMFQWAEEQDPDPSGEHPRVPCLICLDEAQHFLPQNSSVSNIAEQQARELLKAFMDVNARGRKRGLTPVIATQRPAQIRKEVITGSEIYFLMKQTSPRDLDAYEELIGRANLDRRAVASFQKGESLVFESGESWAIRFYERESEHSGHTPSLTQALKRYSGTAFSATPLPFPDDTGIGDEDEEEGEMEELQPKPVTGQEKQKPGLLQRGVNAYLEGSTTVSLLQAMLGISNWEARQLMPQVKLAVQKQGQESVRACVRAESVSVEEGEDMSTHARTQEREEEKETW